jgi:hypothetical protein
MSGSRSTEPAPFGVFDTNLKSRATGAAPSRTAVEAARQLQPMPNNEHPHVPSDLQQGVGARMLQLFGHLLALHLHEPFWQVSTPVHVVPHAPQLLLLLCSLTHAPLQRL